MTISKTLQAGLTLAWSVSVPELQANDRLLMLLRGPGVIDLTAALSGTTASFTVAAAATAKWPPGLYQYNLVRESGADRFLVGSGAVTVEPDFAALPEGHDPRTHAQRMLDSINKVLEGRVLSDHERYSIEGRAIDRIPIMELHKLRRIYKHKVARENGQNAAIVPSRILARLPG